MTGRTRHVYFEDELEPQIPIRRTRGGTSSGRSHSAERVHSIFDDLPAMQGRDRAGGVRADYDQLLRENQYLRIELRGRGDSQTWIAELQRENDRLERENRELRRSAEYNSDNEARRDTKLSKLKAKLLEYKTKYTEAKEAKEVAVRRAEDADRRIEVYRRNLDSYEAVKIQLEQENSRLKRELELEQRLRRRYP
ncbi:hypothetical protein N0V88_000086 [Collariella sp. IMI 366227]|nr:hypothetical protein N0V88_000086 [Collariella sp. IMI 366227]